ncbi:hypothetical protein [Dyella tabacisoli]|uniref:MACPF domain-containing protein n=1 Tax=Dyella tabacisoli TaxID=2282381 RepID=A0A369UJZ5_9GAMM|nr:hypothetical protein [Dyella tabacisoli]RDD80435.1 hypothetical protein DVJ77_17530 [Dyella tabacisoli]
MTMQIQLGDSANVLLGLKPGWFGGAGETSPFVPPPQNALLGFALTEPTGRGDWGEPEVSFHDDVESLLDTLFDYRVRPIRTDLGRFALPSSALMLGGERRAGGLRALNTMLGLPPASLECGGLVLLRLRREDADCRHEAEEGGIGRRICIANYWTREGRHAMGRLRVARRMHDDGCRRALIHRRQAERYLDYLYTYGTHFISRVGLGDQLFQVLVCHPQRYRLLRTLWPQAGSVSGQLAMAFAAYTGNEWIASHGRVCSAADDPDLARSVEAAAWRDPRVDNADSLLTPFTRSRQEVAALLEGLHRSVPIRVEFSAHSPYMDDYRADAWQRVFKGALLQCYGDAVRIPLGDGHGDDLASSPSMSGYGGGTMLIRESGHSLMLADVTSVDAELAAQAEHSQVLSVFARQLQLDGSKHVVLPGQRVTLFAFAIDAGSKGDRVPMLCVSDAAFSEFRCFTSALYGAICVSDTSGCRRDTLFQGLHFGFDEQARVVIRGELAQPDAATMMALREALIAALADAEARLLHALLEQTLLEQASSKQASSKQALSDGDSAPARAARNALAWLAESVRDSAVADFDSDYRSSWEALRRRAGLLSTLGPIVGEGRVNVSALLCHAPAELFLRQRLLATAPQPAEIHALSVDFQQATECLLAAMSPPTWPVPVAASAALSQCLATIDATRTRGMQTLHLLLDERSGEPSPSLDQAKHLLGAIAWYWADGATGSVPQNTGDAALASVLDLLSRAEKSRVAAMLLYALSTDAEQAHIDALIVMLGTGPTLGLTRRQWETLPATLTAMLTPLAAVADGGALRALLETLQELGSHGVALADVAPTVQCWLQARYRTTWHEDFPAPDQPLMRLHYYSRHLCMQFFAAQACADEGVANDLRENLSRVNIGSATACATP